MIEDRPIAKYEGGYLLQDIVGVYQKVPPWMLLSHKRYLTMCDPKGHAERINQINQALEAYEEAQRNA